MTKIYGVTSVLILATFILSFVNITKSTETKLPNDLQNVLRKYGKQSKVSHVEDALRAKIAKLMPLLDDNKGDKKESIENDINWYSDSLRNRHFKPVNKRYKKLRNQIEKLLKIEAVSEETRKAVTNALDEITADLMTNECLWKNKIEGDENLRTMHQTELIMKHIQQKWNKIFNQNSIKYNEYNDTARKTFGILTGLRDFVFDVHEEYKGLENQYAVKCDSGTKIKKKEATKKNPPNGQNSECNIQICSTEILIFMMDFYNQVREAYSDVFNNYIEMYQKEVKEDERRGGYYWEDSFENHMNQLEAHVEKKIENSFVQGMEPLDFTANYTLSILDAVGHFIDKTIHDALKQIDKSISRILKTLPSQLRLTVKADLKITAGIELENLKQLFRNKICTAFQTCNGVAISRKFNDRNGDSVGPNSIHVKFKLGFDKDPLKDILTLLGTKLDSAANGYEKAQELDPNKEDARKDFGYEVNQTHPYNINIYNHFNVTRTTLKEYIERGTRKITEISSLVTSDATVSQFSIKENKSLLV